MVREATRFAPMGRAVTVVSGTLGPRRTCAEWESLVDCLHLFECALHICS